MFMSPVHKIPLLLSVLVGLLLSLIVWGLLRARHHEAGGSLMGTWDNLLLGLLVLAGFALSAFLTYLLLSTNL
jgi:hypothetical protein